MEGSRDTVAQVATLNGVCPPTPTLEAIVVGRPETDIAPSRCRNPHSSPRKDAPESCSYDKASSIDCSRVNPCPAFHSASKAPAGIPARRVATALWYSSIEASEPRCALIEPDAPSRASSAPTNCAAIANWFRATYKIAI